MVGEWSAEVPTEPGRYFYREPERGYYGVCLVAWDRGIAHGDYVRQPELTAKATCIMGQYDGPHGFGENSDHPNWSYGMNPDRETLEFWTEPLVTPDFPAITGRPPDIAPEAIKKEKAKSVKQRKASAKREREQAKARKAAIKKAVSDGADLYECPDCDGLVRAEDRVLGKMRECTHCCTEFVQGEDGVNCPDCNRPFTRLNEEKQTCEECRDGGELPDLTLIVEGGVEA